MRMRSLDLSTSSDLEDISHLFARVSTMFTELGLSWFVIGAFARDLLLQYGLKMEIRRATNDLDLAIAVESWEVFDEIRRQIGETISSGAPHEVTINGHRVDLVPFGGVQDGHTISWPPDHTVTLNVLGFEDASTDLVSVELPGETVVPVASIPGMTLLKLLAWNDRHRESEDKDGIDLKYLVESYTTHQCIEDLYERGSLFLQEFDFDNELAGAALLGSDVRSIAGPVSMQRLEEILRREHESGNLFLRMPGDADHNSRLFEAFGRGLTEVRSQNDE